jgi:uncharacterized protein YxeA
MKKDILIILSVLVTVLGVVYYVQKNVDQGIAHPKLLITKSPGTTISQKNESEQTSPTLLKETEVKKMEDTPQPDKGKNSVVTTLYETISSDEARVTTKPRKNVPHVSAIKLNSSLDKLNQGDNIQLPDIEGVDYDIIVTHIQDHNDGSKSVTGNFSDEDITYTATITTSQKSIYITLSTPNGTYEIEGNNNIGYIYRSDTIKKHLFSPRKTDVVILPITTAPPKE